ncbi:MAG TPA: S9 family peptidase [Longimicrobiaceae bacterium]|nr:S9 family peptidase [Longimicrobiaceae bacterium]
MRNRHPMVLAIALLLGAGPASPPAGAQEVRSDSLFTTARYLDYETVADPQISPDGRQIVYTRRWVNKLKDRWESSLWIMDADGGRNRVLVDGSSAVWSPDGKRIAYLAEGQPKGTQVWVKYLDAEGATQVTRLSEPPANLRWSPDGKWLGFTKHVPQESRWKIDLPAAPEGAQWTEAPRVVDRLHYRADRQGLLKAGNVHLFVVPADGGTARQMTSGDWSVGSRFDQLPGGVTWDWMPDGRTVVVEGLRVENPDTVYRDSYLYAVDVASGAVRQLTPERGSWADPAISPDGRRIAFVGAPYSRMSYRARDVWVMGADGSGLRKISSGFDRDPDNLIWAPDGSGVYFTAQSEGASNVYFASLRGGVRPVTTGAQMLSLRSVGRGGVGVGVRSTFKQPPDVVRFGLRNPRDLEQLTHVNADLLRGVRLSDLEEVWYTSSGGTRVQGWIVTPPTFDPARKYPLILEIHGGPHSMYNVGFNPMFQNFAANGFVVLYTNPRGSTGYGTTFGNAIQRAYPSVDYDDLMAGVDAVIAKGYADPDNLFVGGCSGGGVLTSWVIGHTDRFRAAAVRCPVTNWLSFVGQTDVPLFTANFFDRPFWEDPQAWLKQSPLMYVGNVKTPTLIMTGVLDLRTPMPQSEEYYAALKMRGVPATLLRFEGEYHGTGSRPSNWMRTQLYMMDWYRRWGTFDGRAPEAVRNATH